MAITRRHLLAATAALGAAAAVGVGTTAVRWWDRPPGEGLKVLSPLEHGFVQSVAEAWMPPGGTPALSGADAQLGHFVDETMSHMPATQAKLLKVLLHLLDELTLPTHMSTFHALSLQARQEVLQGWLDSPFFLQRQALGAVMALISFGWALHPEVAPVFQPLFGCGYGT